MLELEVAEVDGERAGPSLNHQELWTLAVRFDAQVQAEEKEDRALLLEAAGLVGRAAWVVGDYQAARQYLSVAKNLAPDDRRIVRRLAELDLETGSFDAALGAYQSLALASAAEGPRHQAEIYLCMGRAQLGLGDADKAAQMVERQWIST